LDRFIGCATPPLSAEASEIVEKTEMGVLNASAVKVNRLLNQFVSTDLFHIDLEREREREREDVRKTEPESGSK
jgi:hypothetical protein